MDTTSGDVQVRDAICEHMALKQKLSDSLNKGQIEMPSHDISRSDACAFGAWLGTLNRNGSAQALDRLRMVEELHTRFHSIAGEAVAMSESGKVLEAKEILASDKFRRTTSSLIINLGDWRSDLVAMSR